LKLIELLRRKGAEVSYNDPYLPQIRVPTGEMESVRPSEECPASMDCVVTATDHSCYDMDEVIDCAKLVSYARGVARGLKGNDIVRLGKQYEGKKMWGRIDHLCS
jgi:UDP-N-acetyl-D-glucosamine dehydrogenase